MKKLISISRTQIGIGGFLGIGIILQTLNLIFVWLKQYGNKEGLLNLIPIISFQTYDPPYMGSGEPPQQIIGFHYFGDWNQILDSARFSNPYDTKISSQTPPFGNLILKSFTFDVRWSFFIIVILSLILWIFATYKMSKNLRASDKVVFFCVFIIGNLGFIESFDRGSLHFFVFSLIATCFIMYSSNFDSKLTRTITLILFVIAVSLKPQLILILFWLIYKKQYRYVATILIGIIITNFMALFAFSGSIILNLKNYVKANLFFTGTDSIGYQLDGVSMASHVLRSIASNNGIEYVNQWYAANEARVSILTLFWMFAILIVIIYGECLQSTKQILLLSLTSTLVAASATYTLCWTMLAWIIFFKELTMKSTNEHRKPKAIWANMDELETVIVFSVLSFISFPFLKQMWNDWRYITINKEFGFSALLFLVAFIVIKSLVIRLWSFKGYPVNAKQ